MSSPRRLLRRNRNRRKLHLVLLPRRASSVQSTRSGLSPPNCQQIGMHIMPAGHIDNAGRRRPTFLNDPKLLDRRPSSPSLWTRQNRNLAHVCSFAGKSISKLSYARSLHGRRSSPEAYTFAAYPVSEALIPVRRQWNRNWPANLSASLRSGPGGIWRASYKASVARLSQASLSDEYCVLCSSLCRSPAALTCEVLSHSKLSCD